MSVGCHVLCGLSVGAAALNEHLFGSASGSAMRVPLFPALWPRLETGGQPWANVNRCLFLFMSVY